MKDGNIQMLDLDFEYKIWKHRLELFINELEILRARNQDVKSQPKHVSLNPVELMVLDEHQSQLEKVYNRIKTQEHEMQFYNKDFPITRTHEYFVDHENLRKKVTVMTQLHIEKISDLVDELGI